MKYQEKELKEMISNLELVKKSDKWGLQDQSEIELTTYKLLLEDYTKNKYKEIDELVKQLDRSKWNNRILRI
tara:strand:- start:136 stop:351 length:216 start_codon:yes stop_codon:yes gene_type:complete